HRAGITTVIIPADNRRDVEEIPENARADITLVEVSHMDEVLAVALTRYGASDSDEVAADETATDCAIDVMVPPPDSPPARQHPAAL
ncbi:MAG TPA: endopeptidase La, partial [Firmicutes bacterium]|nr:endopeptidase La [Bacillota bacterium]